MLAPGPGRTAVLLSFSALPGSLSGGCFHRPSLSSQTSVDPLLVQSHLLRSSAWPSTLHAPSPAVLTPFTNSHPSLPYLLNTC